MIRQCYICNRGFITDKIWMNLCEHHRKQYIYNKKYDFYHVRGTRRISKLQTQVYSAIKIAFGKKTFQEVLFPWCYRTPAYRYDIVVPDMNLVVECDGKQHFEYIEFFMKDKKNFEKYKAAEQTKMQMLKEHGWLLVRFTYAEKLDVAKIKNKITYCIEQQVCNNVKQADIVDTTKDNIGVVYA